MTDCPYARSTMTPCVRRDGDVCWAMDAKDQPICVGCEHSPKTLGLPPPADWAQTVARYYREVHGR